MTHMAKSATPPVFQSRLRLLSHLDYARMSPGALQRREHMEAQEHREWAEQQQQQKEPLNDAMDPTRKSNR
jgi:hypothetical protein